MTPLEEKFKVEPEDIYKEGKLSPNGTESLRKTRYKDTTCMNCGYINLLSFLRGKIKIVFLELFKKTFCLFML